MFDHDSIKNLRNVKDINLQLMKKYRTEIDGKIFIPQILDKFKEKISKISSEIYRYWENLSPY